MHVNNGTPFYYVNTPDFPCDRLSICIHSVLRGPIYHIRVHVLLASGLVSLYELGITQRRLVAIVN